MPRCHSNTIDGGRDDNTDGTGLADDRAARVTVVTYAGDVLSDRPDLLQANKCFAVEVTGEDGELLFSVVTKVENGRKVDEGH